MSITSCGAVGKSGVGCLAAMAVLTGCTNTPSIERETAAIPVAEIVERVKCEIWVATKEKLADPHFAFLNKWDATVDLTLIVDDQAGIDPGVSLIQPLKSVTQAGKGTFSQSFTLGLGGGVTGQANLTDTVSFSLALTELNSQDKGLANARRRDLFHNKCAPFQEGDLIGKLHLQDWVTQTLIPVYNEETGYSLLTKGVHPAVKGGGNPAGAIKKVAADAKPAVLHEIEAVPVQNNEVKPQSAPNTDEPKTAPSPPATLTQQQSQAIQDAINPDKLSKDPDSLDKFLIENRAKIPSSVLGPLEKLQGKIEFIKSNVPPTAPAKPKGKPKENDPLDTISHEVQFIVTWNANATPSWSLFDIKGPGPAAGSFLSSQHQTTHQLLITMGPAGGDQTVRSSQLLNAAIRQLGPIR